MGYDNISVWIDPLLFKPWYIEYLPIIISFIGLLLVIAGWAVTNHLNMKLQKRKLYYDSLIVVKNDVIASIVRYEIWLENILKFVSKGEALFTPSNLLDNYSEYCDLVADRSSIDILLTIEANNILIDPFYVFSKKYLHDEHLKIWSYCILLKNSFGINGESFRQDVLLGKDITISTIRGQLSIVHQLKAAINSYCTYIILSKGNPIEDCKTVIFDVVTDTEGLKRINVEWGKLSNSITGI